MESGLLVAGPQPSGDSGFVSKLSSTWTEGIFMMTPSFNAKSIQLSKFSSPSLRGAQPHDLQSSCHIFGAPHAPNIEDEARRRTGH